MAGTLMIDSPTSVEADLYHHVLHEALAAHLECERIRSLLSRRLNQSIYRASAQAKNPRVRI